MSEEIGETILGGTVTGAGTGGGKTGAGTGGGETDFWANLIKSGKEFLATGPISFAYFYFMALFGQNQIGLSKPWAYALAGFLFLLFVGMVRFLWGEHFPKGRRIYGFFCMSAIVSIIALTVLVQPTIDAKPRDINWMTTKITAEKQNLFRVYAGDTIYYYADKGFWVEYEGGNKYFNNPSYNGQMMRFKITTAKKGGEIVKAWGDEPLQLKYKVESQG